MELIACSASSTVLTISGLIIVNSDDNIDIESRYNLQLSTLDQSNRGYVGISLKSYKHVLFETGTYKPIDVFRG